MLALGHKSSLIRSSWKLYQSASRVIPVSTARSDLVKPNTINSVFFSMSMGMSMSDSNTSKSPSRAEVKFSEQELRSRLTPLQYHVTQEKGTERAFTGELTHNKETGVYGCVVCGESLFKSDHKFDSGSGWPSFYEIMNSNAVEMHTDLTHGMKRVEVTCKKCGSHLGHVFDDGPNPTGQRYCINSASLKFNADKKSEL